ncbi:MAG: cupin domain-containing protein [Candidatus Rokuibacteriota bacterium]|nr:MAG: cupin domain-containing protein [Candidatus Rokubacteria bacterium]
MVAEWRDERGGHDPPLLIAPCHLHRSDDEAWYVLEGALAFRVDDEELEVPAGAGVLVPAGSVHTWWNPQQAPARYLIVMTARIARLVEAIHAAEDRSPEAMQTLFATYDSELVG